MKWTCLGSRFLQRDEEEHDMKEDNPEFKEEAALPMAVMGFRSWEDSVQNSAEFTASHLPTFRVSML
jgi:hypothetical protein